MLTVNEKKVLRLLFAAIDEDYSINAIARECGLAPNGAAKILRKLEQEGVLKAKSIANIRAYRIDFKSQKAQAILELAMIPEIKGRLQHRLEDLEEMKEAVKACIAFGSYIGQGKEPNDIDLIFIISKEKFKQYKDKLPKLRQVLPVKLHELIQTEEDLKSNILRKDKVILGAIREGVILWGQKLIIELVQNARDQAEKMP
jgi:DNA-binding Lrp family transcriptional regulator